MMLTVVLTIAVTVGALAWVLWPLWRRYELVPSQPEGMRSAGSTNGHQASRDELLSRRDALYAMLQDAEFDHNMGKLGDSDYQAVRARAMREAAQVLRQLDRLTPEAEAAVDREIEDAVARLQAVAPGARQSLLPAAAREAVETEVAALIRHAGADLQAGEMRCPNCGYAYRAGDAFCVHCGAALGSGARSQGL